MTRRLRFTILGCGSSPGVPRIGNDWGACDPDEPRNRRRRCAALAELFGPDGTTRVGIDCGPDFREQMLSAKVPNLDAVVLTHAHADHIHGIDDLRGFVQQSRTLMPLYCDDSAFERTREAFGYCFETPPGSAYPPIARRVRIEAGRDFEITGPGGAIVFQPFRQEHGGLHSLGFRIGSLAYCCDVSGFDERAIAAIAGARHLVIGALQYKRHFSHLSLDEALEWIERLGVPQATLTHMHTPLDYATLVRDLPPHIRPAYDGLRIEFDYGS